MKGKEWQQHTKLRDGMDTKFCIDRELFQRIMDGHLDLAVEARTFRALRNRAGIGKGDALLKYGAAHKAAELEQKKQIEGTYDAVKAALESGDDEAAQYGIRAIFPPVTRR